MAITAELKHITEDQQTLNVDQARDLMTTMLAGAASDLEIASLLGALAARGETAQEIAGFALAIRQAAVPLPLTEEERNELVDTCGTGGDGAGTYNISTAAALVAAAAGVKVAKHGNRAVTSSCGSADVLEALGVPIDLSPEAAAGAIREHGFCFLLASAHHPGMRAVMPIRRALGVRTIFNLLGPLLNPAGARRQVMGVYSARVLRPLGEAMPLLDVQRAMIVHGAGGLDELSLCGPTEAVLIDARAARNGLVETSFTPGEMGLSPAPLSALAGGSNARENAAILQTLFAGQRGPKRDAMLLNAAAVLMVAGRVDSLQAGLPIVAEAVDRGAVTALVQRLRAA